MSDKTILYPTDFSAENERALHLATVLARDENARLLIVHVSELEQYPVGEPCPEEPELDQKELEKLKSIVPPDPAVSYEHRLIYGEPGSVEIANPADEIVKLVNQEHVDMIVMGTHGRTGFKHLLMGSVAEAVVRHAPCAVVTIKLPETPKI